jgi:Trypsin
MLRHRCCRRVALVALVGSLAAFASASPSTASVAGGSSARARALKAYRTDPALTAYRAWSRRARHRAIAAVVGGTQDSIQELPWQVAVFAEFEVEGEIVATLCSGSIVLDLSHVLTAGHCVFNPVTRQRLPAEDFAVVAGVSSLKEISTGPTSQERLVGGVRAHPYFNYAAGPGTPDDVAVLTLASPLEASSAVTPVTMATSGSPPRGSHAVLSGFGEENPLTGELNGNLYSLGVELQESRRCGGPADALFLCGSNSAGTACSGDSGGSVLGGESSNLVGVIDTVAVVGGQRCTRGALDGFANVTAPEIRDFVEGSESPPRAPQGGGGIVIRGFITVGNSLTCEPGSWTNSPSLTFAFIDDASGQTLQRGGSTTYALSGADVGRTIACEVAASNAGGTGTVKTAPLPPIKPSQAAVLPVGGGSSAGATGAPPAAATPPPSQGGGVAGSTAQHPSAAQIRSLIEHALNLSGRMGRIASLIRLGGVSTTFTAPEAGTLTIDWYLIRAGAHSASAARAKRVLVASGHRAVTAPGVTRVSIRLTPAGRRELRGGRRVTLTATGSFSAAGQQTVTASRTIVLSR